MSELSVGTLSGLAANSYVIDVASGSSLDLSNATDLPASALPAGSIIAVKDALFTGVQSASVVAGGNIAVTDLSITHEVANASNKLIISAFLGAAANSRGFNEVGIAVHDGSGLISVGASPGSRTAISAGGRNLNTTGNINVVAPSVTFVHTPGSGSKTYTVRAVNIDGSTRTLFVNRSQDDTDDPARARAVSALVIQEVAA